MNDKWIVTTERMQLTLVSEPPKAPSGGKLPPMPAYVLVQRPGGGEPIRIEGDDVELMIWVLMKLQPYNRFMGSVGAPILGGP